MNLALFDLPDVGRARRRDPATSREAARKVGSVTDLILRALEDGPAHADEVVRRVRAMGCARKEGTIVSALSRLTIETRERRALVVNTGETVVGDSGTGQMVRALR